MKYFLMYKKIIFNLRFNQRDEKNESAVLNLNIRFLVEA